MWKAWLKKLTGRTPATADTACPPAAAVAETPAENTFLEHDWKSRVTSCIGFEREAGLQAIRSSRSAERLAAIVVRLNDWVPQVRAVARAAFDDYLIPPYAPALIAQICAILALEHRRREDHGVTITKLEVLLASPECLAQTAAAFENSRGAPARLFFRVLAQKSTEEDIEALLIKSLHHVDFSVRRLALAKAMELPQASAQKAIAFGLASNSSILRRLSFLKAIELETGRAQLIYAFLTDPSPATRWAALWAAKQHGVDPLQVLHARLDGAMPDTKSQWLGVLGLAQYLGARIPVGWLRAALSQNSGAVRSLVLSLEGGDKPDLLIAAIGDPSRCVFEAGVQGLRSQPWSMIDAAFTRQLELQWGKSPSRRPVLLELMPKWTQAGFLLEQLNPASHEPSSFEQIRQWADAQTYSVSDRETSKNARSRIIEQLTALEAERILPPGSVTRLT